jgi:hypothetical protein
MTPSFGTLKNPLSPLDSSPLKNMIAPLLLLKDVRGQMFQR